MLRFDTTDARVMGVSDGETGYQVLPGVTMGLMKRAPQEDLAMFCCHEVGESCLPSCNYKQIILHDCFIQNIKSLTQCKAADCSKVACHVK